jgi:hypothetical protein
MKSFNLLTSFFLILILVSASGCIDQSQNDSSYIYNDTDFENAINDPYCLAARGTMPENPTNDDKIEWAKSLTNCFAESVPEMKQFKPNSGGIVLHYGYTGKGYVEVELGLDYVKTVNESTINNIYQVLDEHCESCGISDVPVVFIESHYVDEGGDY